MNARWPVRQPVDRARIDAFLEALGKRFHHAGRVLLVGGTTVVYQGLRNQTIDVDLTVEVESRWRGEFVEALRELKEELDINVEEVSPGDFIPLPAGSAERAVWVGKFGMLDVLHFDPYSVALSKIERGSDKDMADVRAQMKAGFIEPGRLDACFNEIMERYGRESIKQDPARFRLNFDALRKAG
jgi:hypothetical protein